VYVEGGFRDLDTRVTQEISTAPPPRLRIGGNTQAAKIIHKVEPIYPAAARAAKAKGSVLLHAVIETIGLPRRGGVPRSPTTSMLRNSRSGRSPG
jgi:hypothetical protein